MEQKNSKPYDSFEHKKMYFQATGGGRMKFNHFEMIRMAILKNVDYNKVFAIWRVPSPWQPITKKVRIYIHILHQSI